MKAKILDEERIESTKTVIFIHGSYAVGDSAKNVAAARRIREEGIASTILYESSRDWEKLKSAQTDEDWITAFRGKKYRDEIADLLDVLEYAQKAHEPKEIFLSGTSYGASLAIIAAAQFPCVTRLFLSAPQLTTKEKAYIYDGFPSRSRFAGVLRRFHGDIGVLVAGIDNKQRLRDAHFILQNAQTRHKRLYIVHANHGFDVTDSATSLYADRHVLSFGNNQA